MNIAIKVFNLELETALTGFDNECKVLYNLRHRNLIKIISIHSRIKFKALILEHMPLGSLENWLYNPSNSLSMLQRLNIMIDVASALEYLHHGYSPPVVHCDICEVQPHHHCTDSVKTAQPSLLTPLHRQPPFLTMAIAAPKMDCSTIVGSAEAVEDCSHATDLVSL
ncbi:receptor kinase-like protein Xa21 [Ziziphus jujuba]|uniref:Receptor kinase-like protein Xa21 n=1 Tax=Ziziphus jujuba TaxID=326968 RepID=A0ABM4A219_ZIZJJ|nr:receptor kinase-like protein Xa21 [Ziziphus jujuba]